MNLDIFIRTCDPSDQPQIRWLHQRTPPAGQVSTSPQPWPEDLDNIPDNYAAFWVAVERNSGVKAIVGMVGLERVIAASVTGVPVPEFLDTTPPTARLDWMRVAPERQRRGIGRMLTQTAIDWARDNGYRAIILETTPQQEAAVALYEAMGFTERVRSMTGRYELVWFELML